MTTATAMTNRDGAHSTMVWCSKDIKAALTQYNNENVMNGWVDADLPALLNEGKKLVYTLSGFGCKRMVIWEPINQCGEFYVRRSEVVIKK